MSENDYIDARRVNLMIRLRAAQAAGAFISGKNAKVGAVINDFERRNYSAAKQKCGELISDGLWVLFGQLAAQACDEMIALEPAPETAPAVIQVKR